MDNQQQLYPEKIEAYQIELEQAIADSKSQLVGRLHDDKRQGEIRNASYNDPILIVAENRDREGKTELELQAGFADLLILDVTGRWRNTFAPITPTGVEGSEPDEVLGQFALIVRPEYRALRRKENEASKHVAAMTGHRYGSVEYKARIEQVEQTSAQEKQAYVNNNRISLLEGLRNALEELIKNMGQSIPFH